MTSWYSTSWTRRLKVTIDHTKVGSGTENQSDFPVLICGAQITDNRFWFAVLSTGADIVVTSDDGVTKLKRELVSISVSAKTMELYVRVPALSCSVDTVLYIYYGNAAGAETNDTDTWRSDFKAVYHMNDNPDTSTIQDSTTNNNDGAKVGAAQPVEAAGVFSGDKAQSFDAVNDKITVTDAASIQNIFDAGGTVEMIQDGNGTYLTVKRNPGWSIYISSSSGGYKRFNFYKDYAGTDGSWYPTSRVVPVGSFSHIAVTHDASNVANDPSFYVNGVVKTPVTEATTPVGASSSDAAKNLLIGTDGATYATEIMSEIRLSKCIRSAGWLATTYANIIGYATFLDVEFDSTQWGALALTPARTVYKIEIRDNNGLLKHRIVDLEQASLDQSVNNPAGVSLTCPVTPSIEAILDSIQRPNQLWVIKNDTLVFTGNMSLIDIAHSSLESVRIDSLDWMNQLKDELVEYYDAEDTVDAHVEDFLAEQVDVRPVLLGTIEPTLTRDITIERDTIYNALMSMRDSVGGYMTVDPYHKLNWYWTLSESTGQQIRYKKNLVGITKSIDWMNFGNRLYIYGDGCDLTDAGYATTYIEDATSIATYGLVIRKIYKQSYASAATMLNYAYLKIQEMAFPRITYTVDIANMEDFGFTEDELTLGSWLTLIDDEIGVNVDVQIVRIIWDLVRCEKVQIELSVKSSDICDIVPGVYIL